MDYASYILNLTVSEFRALKKAFRVLQHAGVSYDDAINILVKSSQDKRTRLLRHLA